MELAILRAERAAVVASGTEGIITRTVRAVPCEHDLAVKLHRCGGCPIMAVADGGDELAGAVESAVEVAVCVVASRAKIKIAAIEAQSCQYDIAVRLEERGVANASSCTPLPRPALSEP